MRKIFFHYVLVLALTIGSGALLMHISQRVQSVGREIAKLDRAIESEEQAVRVLASEWSYLNRPERLEVLAVQYLDLKSPEAGQTISDIGAIPKETATQGLQTISYSSKQEDTP